VKLMPGWLAVGVLDGGCAHLCVCWEVQPGDAMLRLPGPISSDVSFAHGISSGLHR
jgi:hypothetical protein